jgi:LPXTG-motif cell wall-anchored protein
MKRGKREAKRTYGFGRRFLSVFLAVVMCTSMLQLSVFAAEPTDAATEQASMQIKGETNPVYYTYTSEDEKPDPNDKETNGTTANVVSNGATGTTPLVEVSKTIEATGTENLFDITLNVKTTQKIEEQATSPDASVVLILDLSDSMHTNKINGKERIDIAKEKAIDFLTNFVQDANGAARKVAIVTFEKDGDIFNFGSKSEPQYWIDAVANDGNGDGLNDAIVNCIDGLTTDHGTNIQAGVQLARNLYDTTNSWASPIANISNRFSVLLTDGAPTVRIVGDVSNSATSFVGTEGYNNGYQPVTEAQALDAFAESFVICFDTGVQSWMKVTSSPKTFDAAVTAANSNELQATFDMIIERIKLAVDAWKVTDSIPADSHLKLVEVLDPTTHNGAALEQCPAVGFSGALVWNLRADLSGAATKIYAKDKTTELTPEQYKTYNDIATVVYQLKYRVRLDTAANGFEEGKFYLTNGITKLNYYLQDSNGNFLKDNGTAVGSSESALLTQYFKIPAVKGYTADLSFTKVGPKGEKLQNAIFSLANAANTWSDVATSDEDGNVSFAKKIPSGDTYTLTETSAPAGYLAVRPVEFTVAYGEGVPSFNGGLEDPVEVTYTNVTITKVWQKPADESTPDSIAVTLKQNGKSFLTQTITKTDLDADSTDTIWKYTFTNLPEVDEDGNDCIYTVEEESMYGWAVSYGEQDPLTITNTANGTTIVAVTKNWILPEGMENAPAVTVSLKANNQPTGKTATLRYSASGDTYYFVDLPKYDANGQLISYSVEEAQGTYQMANAIEYGTEGMINTAVITNTVADETTTVSGTKYWNDDMTGRPDSITVTLYADGEEAGTAVATADTNWQYSFSELPRYEFTRDGNNITAVREIEYTVEETAVNGYTSVIDGYNITNTRTGVVDLTVNKVWVDADEEGRSEVEVQLYANGQAYGEAIWMDETHTFENLPKYDEYGLAIEWSVQETAGPMGYIPSYSDVEIDEQGNLSVTITNTQDIIDDTLTVTVTKVWQQPGDIEPQTAYFSLYADGEEVVSKKLALTGNNIGSFTGLPKYKLEADEETGETNLVEIDYFVFEDVPSGYESNLTNEENLIVNSNGDMVYHFVNTIVDEISVSVQKQWVKPATVETPDVTFTVLRAIGSGAAETVGTIVLENGETSGKLDGLDEYNKYGQRYTYSIVEESLSGYSAVITGGVQANGNYAYDVVNTINPANVNLVVSKTWIDGGLDDSERPSVKLWVLQNGMDGGLYNGQSDVRWVEFSYVDGVVMATTQDGTTSEAVVSGNTWSYTFQLPKYSQDLTMEYTYSVAEYDVPAGYTSIVSGTNATNTRVGTIDIPVTKYWVDPAGTDRPEITLTLTGTDDSSRIIVMNDDANGVVTATLNGEALEVTVADNAWTVTVAGLPQYDSNGAVITYTLSEQEVSGYTSSTVEGQDFAIRNTIKQQEISVEATKVWANMEVTGVYTPKYPESITVALFRNGVKVDGSEQTVTKESNYEIAKYDNLPKYASDGSVFSYQIMELKADGSKVDNNGTIGFGANNEYTVTYGEDGTITNSFIVPAKYMWIVKTNYVHMSYDGTTISSYSYYTTEDPYTEVESMTITVDPDDYVVCREDSLTYKFDTSKDNITSVVLEDENYLYELVLNYILVDEEPPAPPAPPSGGGGGGGGTIIIPEPPVPLNPAPEVEIPDVDVPLVEIPEEEVPLVDVPKTGDASALWLMMSVLSGTGLAGMSILGRKKREEN